MRDGSGELPQCRVCGNSAGNALHVAREMMYGFRDEFAYIECGRCRSLHIREIPDLGKYYPDDYYSLVDDNESPPKKYLKAVRARHLVLKRSMLGALLNRVFGPPNLSWLPHLSVPSDAAILDVGSGRGNLLRYLAAIGFTNLTGIDPNVPRDLSYPDGVKVFRGEVWEAPRRGYQFIILQYSLEHVADPIRVIRTTRSLVGEGGTVVVRIPIAGTFAWRTYNVHWASLDPPRHLYIFSESAFRNIAEEAGFDVERVVYDSTDFQFWGSEQLKAGIPFNDDKSYSVNPKRSMFSTSQIAEFKRRTLELNARDDGDLATFFLRPRAVADR